VVCAFCGFDKCALLSVQYVVCLVTFILVTIETFDQSLKGMITESGDCLKIWVAFCDYMRRRASSAAAQSPSHPSTSSTTSDSVSQVEELRSTFVRAREYMKTS